MTCAGPGGSSVVCFAGNAVPEPGSLGLLALGFVAWLGQAYSKRPADGKRGGQARLAGLPAG